MYYKLGNRSGYYDQSDNDDPNIKIANDGAGTLAVAVGAFGVDCLEAIGGNGTTVTWNQVGASAALEGSGFWVGKRPAPSTLVVSGSYEESWYPMYNEAKQMVVGDIATPLPSVINNDRTLPLGTIAPTQVSTVDGENYFDSVGAGKAAPSAQNE
jgi:hypothetical protein